MLDPYRSEIPLGVAYANINTSAATTTLVPGVAGRRIVVLSAMLSCSANVTATFQSSTGPVGIGGPFYFAGTVGAVWNHNEGGWFQTAIGDSLLLSLNPASPVGGHLSYILDSG